MSSAMPETLWFLDGHVTVHLAQAANAGGLSITEHLLPGGFGPPYHIHRTENETLYVLQGDLKVDRGGAVCRVRAGESVHLPRGVPHGFRVESDEGARVLVISDGGFESMVRAVSRPAAAATLPPSLTPTPEMQAHLARLCAANGIDVIGPPIA